MTLKIEDLEKFHHDGFFIQHDVFSKQEIDALCKETEIEFSIDSPRRTLEEKSGVVRGVHGSQLSNKIFSRLPRLPRILNSAEKILNDKVYVHQFKINAKRAFVGEQWEWHQDYLFWHKEDGMPYPKAVTCTIFLDDVHEFNGPLVFTPGGHRGKTVDALSKSDGWEKTLTAELKYSMDKQTIKRWVENHGLIAPKGKKGSVLWFDSNVPHASTPNISPSDRVIVLIAYNSVRNAVLPIEKPRPEWLTNRNFTPLTATLVDTILPASIEHA